MTKGNFGRELDREIARKILEINIEVERRGYSTLVSDLWREVERLQKGLNHD